MWQSSAAAAQSAARRAHARCWRRGGDWCEVNIRLQLLLEFVIEHSVNCLGCKISCRSPWRGAEPARVHLDGRKLATGWSSGIKESDEGLLTLSCFTRRTHQYRKRSMIKIGSRKSQSTLSNSKQSYEDLSDVS